MTKTFAYYLNNYFNIYLPKEISASENTIISYKNTFKLLINFLINKKNISIEKIDFKVIDREIIKEFLHFLEEDKKISINTRNQRLAAIKSFYQYVKIEDPSLLENFQNILTIRTKKSVKKLESYLTIEEITTLFNSIDTTTVKGRRDLVLLSLLYDAGLRLSEIIQIKILDLRLDENPVITVLGKGRKNRSIPIMENTKKLLLQYINNNNFVNTSYLFSNAKKEKLNSRTIQKIIEKYIKLAKIDKNISPHSLRRSRAMHLLEAGINIVYIRDFLGHESITTTELYARANEELKRKEISKAYSIETNDNKAFWNKDVDLLKELLSLTE